MNIAEKIPKIYLIEPKNSEFVKCPNSRIPKKKNVRNRKVHGIAPTFHIRLFLYAVMTRINDVHQNRLERITCSPRVSSTPYKNGISIIITIIIYQIY